MNKVAKLSGSYRTDRLLLDELTLTDSVFFFELVNAPEWIKFIGDRHIRTLEDASLYIKRIMDNPKANYWVVRLQNQQIPIGIITFIKRNYLEYYDIGFAFFSRYAKTGYAYEATMAVLKDVANSPIHTRILGITVKENASSIKLLERVGLRFWKEIKVENDALLLYSATVADLVSTAQRSQYEKQNTEPKNKIRNSTLSA